MLHKLFVKTRMLAFSALIVLGLLASSMPAMAQDGTATTPTDALLADAPAAVQIADEALATDQEHQNKVAFVNSLTEDQRTAFADILAKYKPQLDALGQISMPRQASADDQQLFMPSVIGAAGQEAPSAQMLAASAQVAGIQSSISEELNALLTAEQQALFSKVALAKSPQVSASGVDSPQSSTDCYYAAVYGSVAAYYSYYAELYGYYDDYYESNSYAYYDWLYNYYGKYYVDIGLLYAGGAYARDWNLGPGSWNDTAYDYFDSGEYYHYYGYLYGYYSYYYYSSYYGYYGYYYGYYANLYAYYAGYYSYYCS